MTPRLPHLHDQSQWEGLWQLTSLVVEELADRFPLALS